MFNKLKILYFFNLIKFFLDPVIRLSNPITFCLYFNKNSVVLEPINPATPVTNHVFLNTNFFEYSFTNLFICKSKNSQ